MTGQCLNIYWKWKGVEGQGKKKREENWAPSAPAFPWALAWIIVPNQLHLWSQQTRKTWFRNGRMLAKFTVPTTFGLKMARVFHESMLLLRLFSFPAITIKGSLLFLKFILNIISKPFKNFKYCEQIETSTFPSSFYFF